MKSIEQWEGRDGALSIQPFERGRVTTLWDLYRVSCGGREGGACERAWAWRRTEVEGVMGVSIHAEANDVEPVREGLGVGATHEERWR